MSEIKKPAETAAVSAEVIRIAAALIVDQQGRILLVRKRGTHVFMQPGGKYEPGESAAQALSRELNEELGVVIAPEKLEMLGDFVAKAANETGARVEAAVLRATLTGPVAARAEIEELRWVHPDDFDTVPVAPLVTSHMLPFIQAAAQASADRASALALALTVPSANASLPRAPRRWLALGIVVFTAGVVLTLVLPDVIVLGLTVLVIGVVITALTPRTFRSAPPP